MAATQAQRQEPVKKEGDISDAFVSLSGTERQPLPHRYLELKKSLVSGHEDRLIDSWKRLLKELKIETDFVAKHGLAVIPSIEFDDIESSLVSHSSEIRKRGVVVVRNVIPEMEARAYKDEIEEYVRHNPSTRGTNTTRGNGYSKYRKITNIDQHSPRTTHKCSNSTGQALRSRPELIQTSWRSKQR